MFNPITIPFGSKMLFNGVKLKPGVTVADIVLWTSSLLNAAYFLPILWRAWFRPAPSAWPEEHIPQRAWRETSLLLLIPPLVTAAATLAAGIYSDAEISPLSWAKLIAEREYLLPGAP